MQDKLLQVIDPNELALHPLKKQAPTWGQEDERYIGLVRDIKARGILHPLLVDSQKRLIDGVLRLRAAKQLQIDQVLVMAVPDDQVYGAMLGMLVCRKHYTKSALAYQAYPLMEPAFQEARRRMIECQKQGQNPNVSGSPLRILPGQLSEVFGAGKVEDLAEQIGIGRNLFFEAQKVHQAFTDPKKYLFETAEGIKQLTLREYFEPRILRQPLGGEHEQSRPMGLGAVVAGIASVKATKGQPKQTATQLDLFKDGLIFVEKRFSLWDGFSAEQKREARAAVRELVAEMPEELRAEMLAAIREVVREAAAPAKAA